MTDSPREDQDTGGKHLSGLRILLLGPPRVERDGATVEFDTRKATALVAYLVMAGRRQTRDALAQLLYSEADQSRARAALRRTLSTLNAGIGEWVEIDRETVALRSGADLWVDVEAFRAGLDVGRAHGHQPDEPCPSCVPELAEAVGFYRGVFLADFSVRDSPAFDDWQVGRAESLRRDLARMLDRLVRAQIAAGDVEPAIEVARRWLALDPLHEPAHRQLMRLFTWSGQREAALRQFRECVRLLERHLDVPPVETTLRLHEAIKQNRLAPPRAWRAQRAAESASSRSLPAPVVRPGQVPLVGREVEWAALLDAYSATTDVRLAVVEGEAGVGKTRLAEALVEHARGVGGVILSARLYEGEADLASGAFVQALRSALGAPQARLASIAPQSLAEAARLVPELGGQAETPRQADGPGAQSRFYEGVCQTILGLAGGPPPGILFLDDLQWADAASLDLLAYLVRHPRGRPLLVLATWRREDVPAEHRLRKILGDIRRSGRATHVVAERLGLPATRELVGAVVPGSGPELAERLYRETEGLPFFLVEYLAALAESGAAASTGEWPLPSGVRDLLASRLAAIGEETRQVLQAAAVVGRSFDLETLRAASGRGEEETVAAVEELLAHGIVGEVRSDSRAMPSYDFAHEKLRELVNESTSFGRRRLLHRRVAEALVPHARRQGQLASQVARHFQEAGRDAEAAHWHRLAGEHARSVYANATALAHFRLALDLGHPDVGYLHEAIGDLQTLLGEYAAALTTYEMAVAHADPARVAALERKVGEVHQRRGDWAEAEAHFAAALEGLGDRDRSAEAARTLADWSLSAHHQGEADRALELAGQALEIAEALSDDRALVKVHNLLGVLASGRRDFAAARSHLERSIALADSLSDPGARAAALNNLALACAAEGEVDHGIELAKAALALVAAQGDRHREAALHNNLADLHHAAGRSGEALAHLRQAVAIYAEIGVEAGDVQPAIWKLTEW